MGFILIAMGILFEVTAKIYGINGGIAEIAKTLIATGLLFIAGKELLNKQKVGGSNSP